MPDRISGCVLFDTHAICAKNEHVCKHLAMLAGFAVTCHKSNVNFRRWLEYILVKLSITPTTDMDSLLPHRWHGTDCPLTGKDGRVSVRNLCTPVGDGIFRSLYASLFVRLFPLPNTFYHSGEKITGLPKIYAFIRIGFSLGVIVLTKCCRCVHSVSFRFCPFWRLSIDLHRR